MRLPKNVNISGKTYSVKKNRNQWGGQTHSGPQTISVGVKADQSAKRKFDNFTHEVLEAVAIERNLRYIASDNEVVFVMTHKQFDDYAIDVATALWPMVKGR